MKEKKSGVLSIRRTIFLGHCYERRSSKATRFLAVTDRHQALKGGLTKIKEQTLRLPYQLAVLWRVNRIILLRETTMLYCLWSASQKLCSSSITDSSVSSPTSPRTPSLILHNTNSSAAGVSECHGMCLYWTWVILCALVDGARLCHLARVWATLSSFSGPLPIQYDSTGQWICSSETTPFEQPEQAQTHPPDSALE